MSTDSSPRDPNTPIYYEVLHGDAPKPDGFDYPLALAEARGFELGQGIIRMSEIIQAQMRGVVRGVAAGPQNREASDDAVPDA